MVAIHNYGDVVECDAPEEYDDMIDNIVQTRDPSALTVAWSLLYLFEHLEVTARPTHSFKNWVEEKCEDLEVDDIVFAAMDEPRNSLHMNRHPNGVDWSPSSLLMDENWLTLRGFANLDPVTIVPQILELGDEVCLYDWEFEFIG